MRWLALGVFIGATLTPDRQNLPCIDELWIVENPAGIHLSCRPGAVMEIEGHGVRCTCSPGHTRLVRW